MPFPIFAHLFPIKTSTGCKDPIFVYNETIYRLIISNNYLDAFQKIFHWKSYFEKNKKRDLSLSSRIAFYDGRGNFENSTRFTRSRMKKKEKSIWRTPNVTARSHRAFLPSNVPNQLTPSSAITRASTSSGTICIRPVSNFFLFRSISASGSLRWTGRPSKTVDPESLILESMAADTLFQVVTKKKERERERKGRRRRGKGKESFSISTNEKRKKKTDGGWNCVVARGGVRCYPLKSRLWAVG